MGAHKASFVELVARLEWVAKNARSPMRRARAEVSLEVLRAPARIADKARAAKSRGGKDKAQRDWKAAVARAREWERSVYRGRMARRARGRAPARLFDELVRFDGVVYGWDDLARRAPGWAAWMVRLIGAPERASMRATIRRTMARETFTDWETGVSSFDDVPRFACLGERPRRVAEDQTWAA